MRLINQKHYDCLEKEFTKKEIEGFENLILLNDLNNLERLVGLINDLAEDLEINNFHTNVKTHDNYISKNVKMNKVDNLLSCDYISYMKYEETFGEIEETFDEINSVIISNRIFGENSYKLTNSCEASTTQSRLKTFGSNLYINISKDLNDKFLNFFKYYLVNDNENSLNRSNIKPKVSNVVPLERELALASSIKELNYDNLIHLVVMVKNGGDDFKEMLQHNINIFDRWTILDTGSTDDTIKNVKEVLVNKKGRLYESPFVNFRETRNLSLELARVNCKFILILDDTYFIKGDLRKVLNDIRSDQYADSYSLYIKDDYSKYGSNRIIKSDRHLRYIHRIHEVITNHNNKNILIPDTLVYIYDLKNDKMNERTKGRLDLDLKLLFEEIEDDNNNPRTYYYLGQTYNLLEDYSNAFKYYMKRTEFKNSGFRQELVDAYIVSFVIGRYRLNIEWREMEKLLIECFNLENTRPECPFYMGLYYYEIGNKYSAFKWFKKAFEIGFPNHCQYSLRPVISYCHIPKFLAELCYNYEEYELGLKACELFLLNRNEIKDPFVIEYNSIIETWYFNYMKLVQLQKNIKPIILDKKIFCIVADGGFTKWSGSSILKNGVGGSETWVIETAKSVSKLYGDDFHVVVFCNCENDEVFENVSYYKLDKYPKFISEYYVDTCIISRFSEYLPLTYKGYSENVYLICHDLKPSGNIIITNPKLKNIFCLSEFHVDYMKQTYTQKYIQDLLIPQYYGVSSNARTFGNTSKPNNVVNFIFSSFANRGLLQVLELWRDIHSLNTNSNLYIYCDLNNKWLNNNYEELVKRIKQLLDDLLKQNLNIHLMGWVSKEELSKGMSQSHIWLYPCTFLETFCLTALECALHKVLPITNGIGSLQNTASKGIIIEEDVNSITWREKVLNVLKQYFNDPTLFDKNIKDNYEWALNLTWDNQTKLLMNNYVMKNRLEYKNMFNWTNNLPEGSTQDFIEIINLFNNRINLTSIQILEIGSWSGTSISALVKNIKNSYGTAIDMWDNYEENNNINYVKDLQVRESFIKNVELYNIENRIKLIQGDSKNELLHLIKENKNYDLIYVDGSHLLVDVYVDLYLSWNLLTSNGILIIDDYLFNLDKLNYDNKYITETIKYSVDKFLKEKKGQYQLLKMNYRVFLQKSIF